MREQDSFRGNGAFYWALAVWSALALLACLSPRADEIGFRLPLDWQLYSGLPPGFGREVFAPPYVIDYRMQPLPPSGESRVWLEARAGFPHFSGGPALGMSLGPAFQLPGELTVQPAAEVDFQLNFSGPPLQSSYLQNWKYGAGVHARCQAAEWLVPYFDVSAHYRPSARVAQLEGITTRIGWDYAAQGRLGLRLDSGRFLADLSETVYRLPKTAIASSEFGFSIDSRIAQSAAIGGGVRLGDAELWIWEKGSWFNAGDSVEFLYQAPSYLNDYLMARNELSAELRWKF